MRKLAISAAATIGFTALIFLLVWLTHSAQPDNGLADYDRISAGMTLAEVEEICGGPAFDGEKMVDGTGWLVWQLESGAHIAVQFRHGRVLYKVWHPRQTLLDKFFIYKMR